LANIAIWLMALIGPLAKKVLQVLGVGVVTYGAMTTLVNSLIGHAQSNWGAMAGSALQIASLGGIPEVLGIVTGAVLARVSFLVVGRLAKITA